MKPQRTSMSYCKMIGYIGSLPDRVKIVNIYSHFHDILRLFDVLPIFFSPQVKRCEIVSYKHGIYELLHELPNDLDLGS